MADSISYVAFDGTVTDLSALPGVRTLGDRGLEMPPFDFVEEDVPGQAGTRLRAVRVRPREVTLPFYIESADQNALRTLLRALARTLNPSRGDGKLRVVTNDGTTRDLTCRYAAGIEGDRTVRAGGSYYRRGALVFRGHDPYWYDTTSTSAIYTTGASTTFFPFFPMTLNSDTVFGTQIVDNTGDVEAYPIWTVHGPSTSLTLTNSTTGEAISLPIALTSAQTLTIDTRPFRKTVTRDDGTNLYGSLSTTSVLWSLPLGQSTVQVSLPGSTVDSYVTLTYSRRWLSP